MEAVRAAPRVTFMDWSSISGDERAKAKTELVFCPWVMVLVFVRMRAPFPALLQTVTTEKKGEGHG